MILQAHMILADDFLRTCYITFLSGDVSTTILMRGSDSKYREICFNRAFMTGNSDLKNVTNPCLPRLLQELFTLFTIRGDNVDIGRICGGRERESEETVGRITKPAHCI